MLLTIKNLRVRAEGNLSQLEELLRRQLRQLTLVSDATLSLAPGVRTVILTSYRGGTGTGATLYVGVALREVMDEGGEWLADKDVRLGMEAYRERLLRAK